MILIWFAIFTGFVFFIQYLVYKRFALKHLQYTRKFSQQKCFEGEEIEMVEIISNDKWLLLPWLYVESQLDSLLKFGKLENLSVSSGNYYQNHHSFFTLRGRTKVTRKHKLTPLRRGVYKLNTVTITTGDLLGAVKKSLLVPLNSTLTVYPKSSYLSIDQLPFHSYQGDSSVKRFIMPDPFVVVGTRQYSSGDTFKQINWKATARVGSLQVHQYDFTADRKLMVVLNVDDREGMWRDVMNIEMIEEGIRYAAGVTEAVIKSGMEAGFATNMRSKAEASSIVIDVNAGEQHWYNILEELAKLQLERAETFVQLFERLAISLSLKTDFLILSTYWNDELNALLQQLRMRGHDALVINLNELYDSQKSHPLKQGVNVL